MLAKGRFVGRIKQNMNDEKTNGFDHNTLKKLFWECWLAHATIMGKHRILLRSVQLRFRNLVHLTLQLNAGKSEPDSYNHESLFPLEHGFEPKN
jgi:hypothetical protein